MDVIFQGNCSWNQDDIYPGPETLGDWLPTTTTMTTTGSSDEPADWLSCISLQDLEKLEVASETKQSFDSGVGSSEGMDLFSEDRTTFGFHDCSFASSPGRDLWDSVNEESSNFLYQSSDDGGGDVVDDMDCIDASICLLPSEMDLLNLDMMSVLEEEVEPEPLFNFLPASPLQLADDEFHVQELGFNNPMMYQYQPLVPDPVQQYQPEYLPPEMLSVGPVMEPQFSCYNYYNYNMPRNIIQKKPETTQLPPFSTLPKPGMMKRKVAATATTTITKCTKGRGVGVGGGKGKRVTFKMGHKSDDDAQLAQQVEQVLLPAHLKPAGWKHCQH